MTSDTPADRATRGGGLRPGCSPAAVRAQPAAAPSRLRGPHARRARAGRRRLHRLRPGRLRRGHRAALRRRAGGQGALRQQLHLLPRPQRAGCRGPRAEPDRRRRRVGGVPGRHRPDADGAPGGPGRGASRRSSTATQVRAARAVRPGARRRSRSCPGEDYARDLEDDPEALARGGELFRINCTSCHGFGGGGGALSSGKYAPTLHDGDRRARSTRRCSPARRTCRSSATTSSRRTRSGTIITYVQSSCRTTRTRAAVQPGPLRPDHRGPGHLRGRHRRSWSSRVCGLRGSHDGCQGQRARRRHRAGRHQRSPAVPLRHRPRGCPPRRHRDRALRVRSSRRPARKAEKRIERAIALLFLLDRRCRRWPSWWSTSVWHWRVRARQHGQRLLTPRCSGSPSASRCCRSASRS